MTTPILIVGDGPNEPSGLGRILRDLASLIVSHPDLGLELATCGGPSLPLVRDWTHIPMGETEREGDWGRSFVEAAWQHTFGPRPGILWVIWDPGRLAAYDGINLPVQIWSYPAVDGDNVCGAIGGPAAAALLHADRVIAYGRWGSQILKNTIGHSVPYLPHGLQTRLYMEEETAEERAWVDAELGPHVKRGDYIVGCVATNQPRKDLGLYFRTLQELKARGYHVYGWLHTDVLVKAWSVVQLAEDCGLTRKVTISTKPYTDRELALLYRRCGVTIAPGLGEGFGYPIVESLASGVPVVHGDFGGGRELVPRREWRFPVREIRLEGIYGQQRPVFNARDVANAIERVWGWRDETPIEAVRAYCQGAVAHLDWQALWPRWRGWIRQGVEG